MTNKYTDCILSKKTPQKHRIISADSHFFTQTLKLERVQTKEKGWQPGFTHNYMYDPDTDLEHKEGSCGSLTEQLCKAGNVHHHAETMTGSQNNVNVNVHT